MFYRTSARCAFRLDLVIVVCPADHEAPEASWLVYLSGCELPCKLDPNEALEVVELLEKRVGLV